MIQITFFENEARELQGFAVKGHAGYASAGQDIVCAGVSALVQAAICGLRRFLSQAPLVKKTEKSKEIISAPWLKLKAGEKSKCAENIYLEMILPQSLNKADREKAAVILETLELGLQGIAQGYRRYVLVRRCYRDDERV